MTKSQLTTRIAALLAVLAASAPAGAGPISFSDLLARPRPAASERIRYGEAPSQFADLWLPAGNGSHPVVAMFHGGCWRADLPGVDLMAYAADDLRQRGIAVWNVEYRRIGEPGGGFPGSFEDTGKALDKLRKIAKAKKLDLKSLVLAGHSAGGHLALWAVARHRLPKTNPLHDNNPLPIKGVVSLAGIADLARYRAEGPPFCGGPRVIDLLVGSKSRNPFEVFNDTSPAELLPLGVPQAVLSGALDPIVPASFGRAYAAKASAAGDKVQEMTFPDAGHFELIDPQSAAFDKIRALVAQFAK